MSDKPTTDPIEELEALEREATPGPWSAEGDYLIGRRVAVLEIEQINLEAQLATAEADKARAVREAWESAAKVCQHVIDDTSIPSMRITAVACRDSIRSAAPKGGQGE